MFAMIIDEFRCNSLDGNLMEDLFIRAFKQTSSTFFLKMILSIKLLQRFKNPSAVLSH